VDAAPTRSTTFKIRVPYWATKGAVVAINGEQVPVTPVPSTYMELDHPWKTGDVITLDMPLTLHIDQAPDDKQVQAAMYGPLVLAVRMGTEGLSNSMIYGGSGPFGSDDGDPMPTVNLRPPVRHHHDDAAASAPAVEDNIWFERVEASRSYPLQFRSKGHGPTHTLVPLNLITDERYSVYVRNQGVV
jgi:DUF1680 family protein